MLIPKCTLFARQHAGHLAQKGTIVHYEVGETGTEKVKEGVVIV